MRFVQFSLIALLLWLSPNSWSRPAFDDASATQVVELVSVLSRKLEPDIENAIRNSVEMAIWSLEERNSGASRRALARLVGVRLGESSVHDRDCAILKRGASMLKPLKARNEIAGWCKAKATELNVDVRLVCLGQAELEQSATLLAAAVKSGRRCER